MRSAALKSSDFEEIKDRNRALRCRSLSRDGAVENRRIDMEERELLMQFFEYAHLPEHLQAVSKPFGQLAELIVTDLPRNPERTVALRKLLESKDCAVRAKVMKIGQ